MELSPTVQRPKSIGNIDLFTADQKYDFKRTAILRKRQRPLLLLLDRDGQLLFSSVPSPETSGGKPAVSVETVGAYSKSIRAKLGAKTRTAIVSIVHGLQAEAAVAAKNGQDHV